MHEPVELAHPPGERKGAVAAWWLVVAAAAVVRVIGAQGDLWLDEIWSMELARVAGSAGGVFTQLHHDNNHHLNTLWLDLVGYEAGPIAARFLAIAAGTAMVAVAALGGGRDRALSLAWAFLLAFSFVLVHYGSEARGYGPALLFAVAAYAALDGLLATGRASWGIVFAGAAVLGLVSHLTFLYAFLAFLAWAGAFVWKIPRKAGLPGGLALAFLPPIAFFLVLWAVDLRHLTVGGGPEYRFLDVLRELVRTTFGIPAGPLEWLALPVLALPAFAFSRLVSARDARWVFFLVVVLVGPAAVLLATRPEYLAPRYFLVAVPFLLWLTASGALALARSGKAGRTAVIGMAILFLIGSGAALARLVRDGRGQYRDALAFILRNEAGPVASLGSDHDFRNGTVIAHHVRDLPGANRFLYLPSGGWTSGAPRWVLVHHFESDPEPDTFILGPTGSLYDLVRVFPYAGLSGWDWYVYRISAIQEVR